MSSESFITFYTLIPLTAILVYYFYLERRRIHFHQLVEKEKVFRCAQCGMVYTDDIEVESSPCPKCGRLNGQIKF
ncbi:MAG TPA: hypothetical protein PLW02_05630 [Verrucomicrobiota bacterium]|nr:hypothetical protein [Verrucomicrobiota bacterium]